MKLPSTSVRDEFGAGSIIRGTIGKCINLKLILDYELMNRIEGSPWKTSKYFLEDQTEYIGLYVNTLMETYPPIL